jgi:hypothetical protein
MKLQRQKHVKCHGRVNEFKLKIDSTWYRFLAEEKFFFIVEELQNL